LEVKRELDEYLQSCKKMAAVPQFYFSSAIQQLKPPESTKLYPDQSLGLSNAVYANMLTKGNLL